MDCAKAAAAAAAMDCTGLELLRGRPVTDALPLIAVPTTAGTGSEVGWGAVLSDHAANAKIAIFGSPMFPRLALVDPVLTYTVPPAVTASTGLDVIAHSLDAMCSVRANPVSDGLAVRAAKLAFENLEAAFRDGSDAVARERMAMASTIAGYAFSNTGTTGSHACSYLLTAKYHIPHGEACALTGCLVPEGRSGAPAAPHPQPHDGLRRRQRGRRPGGRAEGAHRHAHHPDRHGRARYAGGPR